ncbi:hypothetical protein T4D_7908 [Trichinella pseudospiralis]|uniref:Uncharacterized protein n=1 Tax=Trichinella pseudospiralis TaxID=6337 RepID=A0A0V1DKI6_TRIPS|nr:hypothetical protein T4D_7908 [Trichinella pseudospiralis]
MVCDSVLHRCILSALVECKTRPSRDENRMDEMQDTTIGE